MQIAIAVERNLGLMDEVDQMREQSRLLKLMD